MTLATTRRYDPGRVSARDGRAVVVGASVAGLLAGRVLADGFEEVTILERDSLPEEPIARGGVPQSSHAHLLMEGGRATIEDLCPGYSEGLIEAGALLIDGSSDVKQYLGGDFLADGTERTPMYAASRPLFEREIRTRVAARPGVSLREGCSFVEYLSDGGDRIEGVRVRESGSERELYADLVVDATGRTSRTPRWLESHGYDAPPVDEVPVNMRYSTARFERPESERFSVVMLPDAPRTRGWAAFPIEGGEWIGGLSEIHGTQPPTDPEEFKRYIADRPTDLGRRFVETYDFSSVEIEPYPFAANLRRRYETLSAFPEGLVVVGDAISSFNPIYGQGMSVAALEALALHACLSEGYRADIAPAFFDRAAPIVDIAWKMAVGADFEFDATTGPKPRGVSLFNRYVSRLVRKAHTDGALRSAFYRVVTMQEPPTALFRPAVLRRVASPRTRTTGTGVDPAAVVGGRAGGDESVEKVRQSDG